MIPSSILPPQCVVKAREASTESQVGPYRAPDEESGSATQTKVLVLVQKRDRAIGAVAVQCQENALQGHYNG
ncbi:hypothetical protein M407DRAFT_243915 [Tulasnella calospora MUT 4182]|uniref:Uncharacterized protein n=1 Tax=Tulasnella calospora MUT 4182 TaxID=1051891 RepID=A0A0C3LWZ2_9AGAM|nr:hypothetical protein M407DRAFT_243915 [Tulasnella calospora MUT 4182]